MVRLVKRYGGGSRKLYDTEESRYVSLDEVAGWVREGQDVQVLDSGTGEDVTRQVLAQIILEGEKQGASLLSADLFHAVIRRGEAALQRPDGAVAGGRRPAGQGVGRSPAAGARGARRDGGPPGGHRRAGAGAPGDRGHGPAAARQGQEEHDVPAPPG